MVTPVLSVKATCNWWLNVTNQTPHTRPEGRFKVGDYFKIIRRYSRGCASEFIRVIEVKARRLLVQHYDRHGELWLDPITWKPYAKPVWIEKAKVRSYWRKHE